MAKRSPIVLKCEHYEVPPGAQKLPLKTQRLIYGPSCKWRQRRPFKIAKFVNRRDPEQFAVVHPSTKIKGRCQVSFFDAQGPYRDIQSRSCASALKELSHTQWKLSSWK